MSFTLTTIDGSKEGTNGIPNGIPNGHNFVTLRTESNFGDRSGLVGKLG